MDVSPAPAAAVDYPQMFRRMIVRSTEAALATVDPQAAELAEDVRERSLYALGLALDLPEAWPAARELLASVSQPLGRQGALDKSLVLLERGIAVAEAQADPLASAQLHVQLGWCHWRLGQLDQAQDYTRRGYDLAHQQLEVATRIAALDVLASVAVEYSDVVATKAYVQEIFDLTDADDPRRAHGYACLGIAAINHDEWEDGIHLISMSIRLFALAGQHRFAAQAERNLAYAYAYTRQDELALAHYQRALDTFARYPSVLDVAQTQMELGFAHWRQQNHQRAIEYYKLCEPVLVTIGDRLALGYLYNYYGLAYTGLCDFEAAARCFAQSLELIRELNMPALVANVLESLGRMYGEQGLTDTAVATWEQGLAELSVMSEPPGFLRNLLLRRIREACRTQGELHTDSP